jgi:hypothetical protein
MQAVAESVGDLEGEPLVGTLKAKTCAFGLEPDEVAWTVRLPRGRDDIG